MRAPDTRSVNSNNCRHKHLPQSHVHKYMAAEKHTWLTAQQFTIRQQIIWIAGAICGCQTCSFGVWHFHVFYWNLVALLCISYTILCVIVPGVWLNVLLQCRTEGSDLCSTACFSLSTEHVVFSFFFWYVMCPCSFLTKCHVNLFVNNNNNNKNLQLGS